MSDTERIFELVLQKSEVRYFEGVSDLPSVAATEPLGSHTLVPKASNFAAIDAILPGQRPVNFTVNVKHDLLLFAKNGTQGFVPVCRALGLPDTARMPMFWAMPPDCFNAVRRSGGHPFPVRMSAARHNGAAGGADTGAVDPTGGDDAMIVRGGSSGGGSATANSSLLSSPSSSSSATASSASSSLSPSSLSSSSIAARIDQYLICVPFDFLTDDSPTSPS